ncbi:MAG: MerR family transcriptional regulator [Bacteroidota bacterium]
MDFLQRLYTLAQQLADLMTALLQKLDSKPTLPTEDEFVDTAWVRQTFGLSSSTLSDYRRKGVIPYTYFEERGKYFYRVSDLYRILASNYTGLETSHN